MLTICDEVPRLPGRREERFEESVAHWACYIDEEHELPCLCEEKVCNFSLHGADFDALTVPLDCRQSAHRHAKIDYICVSDERLVLVLRKQETGPAATLDISQYVTCAGQSNDSLGHCLTAKRCSSENILLLPEGSRKDILIRNSDRQSKFCLPIFLHTA
jgi:hypothetical protein